MKKSRQFFSIFTIVIGVLLLISCSEENRNYTRSSSGVTDPVTISFEITKQEKEDLQHLVEEEKLARDVYLYAYEKYGLKVSENISNSEQKHMDRVKSIMQEYNIEDLSSNTIGIFNNGNLQAVYNQLIQQVDQSLVDALLVGATIEDLDIKDIEDFEARTQNEEILQMYSNLKCGSRNHLRAYYRLILNNDSDYQPAYISQELFESIINSENERCGDGNNRRQRRRRN